MLFNKQKPMCFERSIWVFAYWPAHLRCHSIGPLWNAFSKFYADILTNQTTLCKIVKEFFDEWSSCRGIHHKTGSSLVQCVFKNRKGGKMEKFLSNEQKERYTKLLSENLAITPEKEYRKSVCDERKRRPYQENVVRYAWKKPFYGGYHIWFEASR